MHTLPTEAAARIQSIPPGAITQGGKGEGSAKWKPLGTAGGAAGLEWGSSSFCPTPTFSHCLSTAWVSAEHGFQGFTWDQSVLFGPRTGLPCLLQ